jgi:hypothetical protein
MPKDNRTIHSAIRAADGTVYAEGMEDELAGAYSQTELEALVESGALSGEWSSTRKAEPKAKTEDKK